MTVIKALLHIFLTFLEHVQALIESRKTNEEIHPNCIESIDTKEMNK